MAFDTEGSGMIQSHEVKYVLDMMGLQLSEQQIFKIISDIDPSNEGIIRFSDFKMVLINQEVEKVKGKDTSELLDAFVAMGGEPDGEGCVDAEKLI